MEKRPSKKVQKAGTTRKAEPLKPIIQEFRRQFNLEYRGTETGEVNNSPSMTIPDMSLTITELQKNHTRTVNINKGEYFDTEIPRFDDITEEKEYKQNLVKHAKEIQDTAREEIKAAEAKKLALKTEGLVPPVLPKTEPPLKETGE